ncbi:MAG: SH3 domain-containing protein [Chryseobacterium sp.]|nr:SH3 domain-containing protein [Candidatus Chryseobacterium enterohippi]
MKKLFSFLFLLAITLMMAQDEVYELGVYQFQENKTQKIFTNFTRVRTLPNINSSIVDSLQSNQVVEVVKKEEITLKLGQRSANWYKIAYQNGDKTGEGYVWGGNLCIGYRNKNGYDFLYGISKTISKKDKEIGDNYLQNIASIKVLENNELIDEVFFETGSGESLSYSTFTIESNHKLDGVDLTLKTMVSGEACGIPSYEQYVLLANKKLIALPQLMNVGDADLYYHSETIVFPNDKGGIANSFILKTEDMEKNEKTNKEKIKRSSKIYNWNGSKFSLK